MVASEPMFSVAPSVQAPCHVPAIPNGSGSQTKAQECSGKLTVEQLAAIEDEELLDKMVLCTRDLKGPLCDKLFTVNHVVEKPSAECFIMSEYSCWCPFVLFFTA